jgi:cell division control protein 6
MKPQDLLMDEETLFRNEEVFTPSYVPEDFIHRDDQLKEISLSLKPGLRGVNPVNTLIHGPPGTGKTTAVKYLLNGDRICKLR